MFRWRLIHDSKRIYSRMEPKGAVAIGRLSGEPWKLSDKVVNELREKGMTELLRQELDDCAVHRISIDLACIQHHECYE